jgi:hypothetical protein
MTRFHFAAALALAAAAGALTAPGASAQPGKAPPVVQFKQFGSTPEQMQQAALARWTGQLVLELEGVKAELAVAKVAPQAKAAIGGELQKAQAAALELDARVRRGANRDQLFAAFADADRSLGLLGAAINQHPAARQATAASIVRAEAAYSQLSAALGVGDKDPTRLKRRLARFGDSLDDNTEELRTLIADLVPGGDRAVDRALAAYAREAKFLSRRVRDDADADLIKRTYEAMAARWTDAAALLGRARQLPAQVVAQAQRVDGLHRRLGTVVNLPPDTAGANPPVFGGAGRFAFAVGADAGAQPRVTVFADERGTVAHNFFAYDVNFDGGVRVDMADLNGDGVPELIAAPGQSPKNPATLPVRVYDGRDLSLLVEFVPFATWKGGLYAVGTDLTKDRRALIAVTAEGTQHVKVFDLAQGKEIDSFFAHDQKVTGGVRLALGDVNGDGVPDLLTVNGPGNAPTVVKVFNGKNREVLAEFPVIDNKYRGGGFIAGADLTGNGLANPVVGLDAGGPPLVRIFDMKGKPAAEFLAFDERFRGGVRVAVSERNRVVAAPGPGLKNSPVRIFHPGKLKNPPLEIVPFLGFDGGLNVGGR